MHYDAAASKAMGVFPSPSRFQLASALGHDQDGSAGLDFSLFSILNKTCTAMGSRMLKGYVASFPNFVASGDTQCCVPVLPSMFCLIVWRLVCEFFTLPVVIGYFASSLPCMFVAWFRWLQHPLVDVAEINRRQAMVQTLCNEKALMDTLQKGSGMLRGMPGEIYLSTCAENSSVTCTFYSHHTTFG